MQSGDYCLVQLSVCVSCQGAYVLTVVDVAKQPFTAAVNAKSVYDHLSKLTAGQEKDKRAAIDLQCVREIFERDGSRLRWIDARYQIATA